MRAMLLLCARLPVRAVPAGETILREGERNGALYIQIEGSVEVSKAEVQVNTVSDPGAIFGEMSVLLDAPHLVPVKTIAPSRFYVSDDASSLMRSDPALSLAVSQLLARRLNAVITYLADLKRQFDDHDHLGMVDEVLETLVHHQGEEPSPGSDRDPDPTVS